MSADRWTLIDKLRQQASLTETANIPDNAIGVRQYASRYRVSMPTARAQLLELERTGRMKAGRRIQDGRWVKLYWVAK